MVTCEPCPYPSKCAARSKCISGRIPGVSFEASQPPAMSVVTTKGVGKTNNSDEVKNEPRKKKAPSKAKKKSKA